MHQEVNSDHNSEAGDVGHVTTGENNSPDPSPKKTPAKVELVLPKAVTAKQYQEEMRRLHCGPLKRDESYKGDL